MKAEKYKIDKAEKRRIMKWLLLDDAWKFLIGALLTVLILSFL